jgi:hypothetical protein
MSAASLTMALLFLAPGQLPSPNPAPAAADAGVAYFATRAFKVPVTIPLALRPGIREMVLYVSRDRGKSWDRVASEPPEKDSFRFEVQADGEYWLLIATVNHQGKQHPESPYGRPPHQKIVIDTVTRPALRITSARRDKDELVVAWEARSAPLPPDLKSFVLEYRTPGGLSAAWSRVVDLKPTPTGEARVRLPGPGPVDVRMQFKDAAGNEASASAGVPGTQGGIADAHVQVARSSPDLPAPPQSPAEKQGPASPPAPKEQTLVPPPPSGVGLPNFPEKDPVAATTQKPPAAAEGGGLPQPPAGNASGGAGSTAESQQGAPPPVATTAPERQTPTEPNGQPSGPAPHRGMPPVQLVNTREVSLEYQLSKVGPSGVGTVKLYITRDGGETWKEFADDPDAKRLVAGNKYQRTLELPGEEGVYGLTLVVQNKAKFGKPPPKAGDTPEMLIEVDRTPPEGKFWPPEPDPERRDAVLIRWETRDKNPAPKPVTLDWAEDPVKGRWRPIAGELEASGRYSWKVPAGTPVQVFLRMRVRDSAGNEATAVTQKPQTVDLIPPEGCLVGVRPVPRP